MIKKKTLSRQQKYYISYTLLFCIICTLFFMQFIINKKSFIWEIDGLKQHYTILIYYGNYLKQLLHNLITGTFTLPMFDFKIGLGEDIITSLSYYVLGDPFTILALFTPTKYMEQLYNIIIILKLYCAGISFSLYCFRMKQKEFPVLIGAISYVFCSYTMFASIRHPYFTNPMIYLPLLFIGIEKILHKEKPYLFIIMVFISCTSNLYFFYTLTIFMIIYGLMRFFDLIKEDHIKEKKYFLKNKATSSLQITQMNPITIKLFLKKILQFTGCYILGIGMSACLLMPTAYYIITSGRNVEGYTENLFTYSPEYYIKFILGFISHIWIGEWTTLDYAPLAMMCVISLFLINHRKYKTMKMSFILATIFLCIPFFGYAFNGFLYVTNRFIWIYSFIISYIMVVMLEHTIIKAKINKTMHYFAFGIYIFVYFISMVCNFNQMHILNKIDKMCIGIGIIFAIITLFLMNSDLVMGKYKKIMILGLVIIPTLVNAQFYYSVYSQQFIEKGRAQRALSGIGIGLIKEIKDEEFYRIDVQDRKYNKSMVYNYNSATTYLSVLNGNVLREMDKLELIDLRPSVYLGFDNRLALNTISNIKYIIDNTSNAKGIPYGYKEILRKTVNGKIYSVYRNQHALPFGYSYEQYIDEQVYNSADAIHKQEMMLEAAVIDSNKNKVHVEEKSSYNQIGEKIPFVTELSKDIEMEGNKIIVKSPNQAITITYTSEKNSENYLNLGKLNIDLINSSKDFVDIKIKSENITKYVGYYGTKNKYYMGERKYLVNLGYNKTGQGECIIYFDKIGEYTFEDFQIYCVPMNNVEEKINKLKENVLKNVEIKNNIITGEIQTEKNKILCLSIPYSKGWTATNNGKKTQLIKTNGMYMGVEINKGQNKIMLEYETPYLKMGIYISIISFIIFGIIFANKKNLNFL